VSRGGGGIQIGAFGPRTAVAYVVRNNQVRGSSGRCSGGAPPYCSGISVGPAAEGTLISHNHVVGSKRDGINDGINILNASTTLTGNRAVRNGKLGINAVLGVIDGGGNLASGNGDPLQCVNATCH
jgi:large repetitive protein